MTTMRDLGSIDVQVSVDSKTQAKVLSFSQPVTQQEASEYLFRYPGNSSKLKPYGGNAFALDTREMGVVMALRPEVLRVLTAVSLLGRVGVPRPLPAWVPQHIRDDVAAGVKKGVSRYPVSGDWGDITVYRDNVSVQVYQAFPEDPDYYKRFALSAQQAHLLHFAFTLYNQRMHELVEMQGMSPEEARSEIRRMNDEAFKIVLECAAEILNGAAIASQIMRSLYMAARKLMDASSRSFLLRRFRPHPALERLLRTQENLQGKVVSRSAEISDAPRTFRHSLTADMPGSSFAQIERHGKLTLSSGAKAHYGEGVYAWEQGATKVGKWIDIEVAAGTAIERLEGDAGVWYRLVPASGNTLGVRIVGTNLTQEEMAMGRRLIDL